MIKLYNLVDLFYKTAKSITEVEHVESELDHYRDPAIFDRLDDDTIRYFNKIEEELPLLKTFQVKEKMKNEKLEDLRKIFNSSIELLSNYLYDMVTNPSLHIIEKDELIEIFNFIIPRIKEINDIMPQIKDFSETLNDWLNNLNTINYILRENTAFKDHNLYAKINNVLFNVKRQINQTEEINNEFIKNKNVNYSYLKDVALFLFERLVILHAVDDSSGIDLINKFVGDIIKKKRFDLLKFLDKRYYFSFHSVYNTRIIRYYCYLFGKANTINDMYKLLDVIREASKYFTNNYKTDILMENLQFKSDEITSFIKSKGKDSFIDTVHKLIENFIKLNNIAHNVIRDGSISVSQIINGVNSDAEKKLIETYYAIIEFKERAISEVEYNGFHKSNDDEYITSYLDYARFNLTESQIIEIKNGINFITDLVNNKKYNYKDIIKYMPKINWVNSKIAYIKTINAGNVEQKTLSQIGYDYLDEQNPNQIKYKKLYDLSGFEPFAGFRFHVVEPNSDRYLTIGIETDCCQRIGGAGEAAAIDSFANPLAGLLLLEEKNNNGKWNLVSQSYFHYVPEQNGFILDNIEYNEYVSIQLPKNFIEACYNKLANYAKELGFKYILAGKGYSKINPEVFETEKLKEDPRYFTVEDPYTDFEAEDAIDLSKMKKDVVVTRKPKPVVQEVPAVKINTNPKNRTLFERPLTHRMNFREFMRNRGKKTN